MGGIGDWEAHWAECLAVSTGEEKQRLYTVYKRHTLNIIFRAPQETVIQEVWGGIPERAFGLMGFVCSTHHILCLLLLPLPIQWRERRGCLLALAALVSQIHSFVDSYINLANIYLMPTTYFVLRVGNTKVNRI